MTRKKICRANMNVPDDGVHRNIDVAKFPPVHRAGALLAGEQPNTSVS